MGFISQHEQAEQLGKEFLAPGLNSWGCERGSRKKPQQSCAVETWTTVSYISL